MASNNQRKYRSLSRFISDSAGRLDQVEKRNNIRGISSSSINENSLSQNVTLFDTDLVSKDYIAGESGWKISGSGTSEFASVFVRGDINADSGTIGDWNLSTTNVSRIIDSKTTNYRIKTLTDDNAGTLTIELMTAATDIRFNDTVQLYGITSANKYNNDSAVVNTINSDRTIFTFEVASPNIYGSTYTLTDSINGIGYLHPYTELLGTFMESSGLGYDDSSIVSGTYVGLHKSAPHEVFDVTGAQRVSNVATLTVVGHTYFVDDLILVTIYDDSTFNTVAVTQAAIVATTTDTISYSNTGSDVTFSSDLVGQVAHYMDSVAGLYVKDYGKSKLDYAYFSTDGIKYVSGKKINLIYNPSFEYDHNPSLYGWSRTSTGSIINAYAFNQPQKISTITYASSDGSSISYTGENNFSIGDIIEITGIKSNNNTTGADNLSFNFSASSQVAVTSITGQSSKVIPIQTATLSGNYLTVATTGNHGFYVGQSIMLSGLTPTAYNGTFIIISTPTSASFTIMVVPSGTSITTVGAVIPTYATGFSIASTRNDTYLTGSHGVAYLLKAKNTAITSASGNGTTITYTATNHGFTAANVGTVVSITGVRSSNNSNGAANTIYNFNQITIASVPSANTFTVSSTNTGTYIYSPTAAVTPSNDVYRISSVSTASSIITYNTATNHNLKIGDVVTTTITSGSGFAFNNATVNSVSPNSFTLLGSGSVVSGTGFVTRNYSLYSNGGSDYGGLVSWSSALSSYSVATVDFSVAKTNGIFDNDNQLYLNAHFYQKYQPQSIKLSLVLPTCTFDSTGSYVTITTNASHQLSVGDLVYLDFESADTTNVFIPSSKVAVVTSVPTSTTFKYISPMSTTINTQFAVTPSINSNGTYRDIAVYKVFYPAIDLKEFSFKFPNSTTVTITGYSSSNNIANYSYTSATPLVAGQYVNITNCVADSYNLNNALIDTATSSQFTIKSSIPSGTYSGGGSNMTAQVVTPIYNVITAETKSRWDGFPDTVGVSYITSVNSTTVTLTTNTQYFLNYIDAGESYSLIVAGSSFSGLNGVYSANDYTIVDSTTITITSATLGTITTGSSTAYVTLDADERILKSHHLSDDPAIYMPQLLDPNVGITSYDYSVNGISSLPVISSKALSKAYLDTDPTGYYAGTPFYLYIPNWQYAQKDTIPGIIDYNKSSYVFYEFLDSSSYKIRPAITVTGVSPSTPSAGYVTYTLSKAHNIIVGDSVTITGTNISAYNISNVNVIAYTSTLEFAGTNTITVASSATGTWTSGGVVTPTPVVKVASTFTNPFGVIYDDISISNEDRAFYGDQGNEYHWYDPTLTTPEQPSFKSPVEWISIDLDSQTSTFKDVTKLELTPKYFTKELLANPALGTSIVTYDTTYNGLTDSLPVRLSSGEQSAITYANAVEWITYSESYSQTTLTENNPNSKFGSVVNWSLSDLGYSYSPYRTDSAFISTQVKTDTSIETKVSAKKFATSGEDFESAYFTGGFYNLSLTKEATLTLSVDKSIPSNATTTATLLADKILLNGKLALPLSLSSTKLATLSAGNIEYDGAVLYAIPTVVNNAYSTPTGRGVIPVNQLYYVDSRAFLGTSTPSTNGWWNILNGKSFWMSSNTIYEYEYLINTEVVISGTGGSASFYVFATAPTNTTFNMYIDYQNAGSSLTNPLLTSTTPANTSSGFLNATTSTFTLNGATGVGTTFSRIKIKGTIRVGNTAGWMLTTVGLSSNASATSSVYVGQGSYGKLTAIGALTGSDINVGPLA